MPVAGAFVVLAGVFLVMMIARAVVVIRENQRGAVVRLGKYLKPLNPGFHIRVPFIDLVTKVDLDASVPGWQGLSDRELEAAVESFATVGTVTRTKAVGDRTALQAKSSARSPEARALAAWLVKTAGDQTQVEKVVGSSFG